MKKEQSKFLITAALPYTNGGIHIGHLAGVYVPSDIFARYQRLKGKDVAFICGSDEHGVPINIKAQQEGVSPQDIVDKYHNLIKKSFESFGISFDIYSRTTSPTHHKRAQDIFKTLLDKKYFEEKEIEQFYDESAKQFLADRYILGTCPKCKNPEAYGDQCEKCGSQMSPQELINPKSSLTKKPLQLKKTKHWYMPLQKNEDWLKKWLLVDKKKVLKSNVYGQCSSWLNEGLQPRAVTRDLDWGVKIPIPNYDSKVMYVWFDAPIGYISFTEEWANKNGKKWEDYWKNENCKIVHFIGKDNIVFHCVMFPIILKEEGSFTLPENIPANEFLNLEGRKLSTSKNWAVWLEEYLVDFPDMQDSLRYALIMNSPETKDSDFTWSDFSTRHQSELIGILGNFAQRVVILTQKHYQGEVPEVDTNNDDLEEINKQISIHTQELEGFMESYRFRDSCTSAMKITRLGNKYLSDNEPWKIYESNPEKTKEIIYNSLQILAKISIVLKPFLPFTAQKISKIINKDFAWKDINSPVLLKSGDKINNIKHLFSPIDKQKIEAQIDRLKKIEPILEESMDNTNSITPISEKESNFGEFQNLDVRVVKIAHVEKVKSSKKLLLFKVDTGLGEKSILSGVAQYYSPEELIGKKVLAILNFPPRPMVGLMSEGMILSTESSDGKLQLLFVEDSTPIGNKLV